MPPLLKGVSQLLLEKEISTRRIPSAQVHVERAIERIKNYRYLLTTYSLSMTAIFIKFGDYAAT